MIFQSEFSVKNETNEFRFFDFFYRRFSQKNVRVWGEKMYSWWKWMQTVLDIENLKPFSDTHSWTLLTHS